MLRIILLFALWFAGAVSLSASTAAQVPGGYDSRHYPGSGYPGGGYPGYPPPRQITCESLRFQPATCLADTRGGVRLIQQTGGVCTRGQTWGVTHQGIWVNNGCRAIFAVTGGRPGPGHPGFGHPGFGHPGPGGHPGFNHGHSRLVVCESWQFKPTRCPANVFRRPHDEIIAGNCIQGQTWGWDRGGIWVDGGCRARFRLG